jgi:peptide/nickel transport system permease protein
MSRSIAGHVFWVIRQNPITVMAVLGSGVIIATAIFSPWIVPYDPTATNMASAFEPPSKQHWAGTDQLGRDIFSRLVSSTRLDLAVAIAAVSMSCALGSLIGGACGYVGGYLDRWIGRFVDILMAFPLFVLAMALVAALGNTVENVVYATAIINLPFYIRFVRAEVNIRRNAGWVEAARLSGNSHSQILLLFLLPNILPALSVQVSVNLGWAILNCAGLSFIGLGVRPPTAEWGIMVAEGANFITQGKWWLVAFPAFSLVFAVLCFNLLGDALRDILDPRMRK